MAARPSVVHGTLRVLLHDTLRTIVHDTTVVRDTLTAFKGAVPSPLRVELLDHFVAKDWINVAVALGAAWLGAWIGARLTRKASIEAFENEQSTRHRDAADRFRRRVLSNLRRVARLCGELQTHEPMKAFRETVGEELEVAWNLYYHVADPIFFSSRNDLPERIDAFFVRIHSLAEHIKAIRAETTSAVVGGQSAGAMGFVYLPHGSLPDRRKRVSEEATALNSQAMALLGEIEPQSTETPAESGGEMKQ
ncbi:MAG TPA: hypothetical protein VI504_10785 [Candidatus Eisenbacteria bacterium]|jgi:hypothetical protein